MPLGPDRVLIAGHEGAGAAGGHGLAGGVLGDERDAAGAALLGAGHGDARLGGGDGAGLVGEAAVDLPAVQTCGDVLELHGAGVAVHNLQPGKLLGGLGIVQIAAAVGGDEVPLGVDRILIPGHEPAAAADGDRLAGGTLGHGGQAGGRTGRLSGHRRLQRRYGRHRGGGGHRRHGGYGRHRRYRGHHHVGRDHRNRRGRGTGRHRCVLIDDGLLRRVDGIVGLRPLVADAAGRKRKAADQQRADQQVSFAGFHFPFSPCFLFHSQNGGEMPPARQHLLPVCIVSSFPRVFKTVKKT